MDVQTCVTSGSNFSKKLEKYAIFAQKIRFSPCKSSKRVLQYFQQVNENGVYISLIDIVLVEPEIPANTGNIARTCAATGARLHLIEPLGFDISERAVKRAGLDYWHLVELSVYPSIENFFERHGDDNIWLATTKAPRSYIEADFSQNVKLIFGKETAGLPESLRKRYFDRCIRIPIRPEARSLNLSNSAAILCFEALRQQGFPQLLDHGMMKEDIL